jgi:hypothetical protein
MTLSGRLTNAQRRSIWRTSAFVCLFLGGAFLCFFLFIIRNSPNRQPLGLCITGLAFGPVVGAVMFGFFFRSNVQKIVEFTCDEGSFRFQKLGKAQPETRALSEIAKVEDWHTGKSGQVTGSWVGFRDGAEVTVGFDLMPDGRALGNWLRAHSQHVQGG